MADEWNGGKWQVYSLRVIPRRLELPRGQSSNHGRMRSGIHKHRLFAGSCELTQALHACMCVLQCAAKYYRFFGQCHACHSAFVNIVIVVSLVLVFLFINRYLCEKIGSLDTFLSFAQMGQCHWRVRRGLACWDSCHLSSGRAPRL